MADAVGTAAVARDGVMPVMPSVEWNGKPYEHVPNANLLAPASLDMERTMFGPRTELALAYARENGVNRIEGAREAWLASSASGKTYYDLMASLRALGLDGQGLERAGIRILKLGMLWPVEPEIARESLTGSTRSWWRRRRALPRDAPQGGALRGGRRAAHRRHM